MKALGKWTDQLDMAEHYSCSKGRTSFCIKAKLVMGTKETAGRVGTKGQTWRLGFQMGDISVQVLCTNSIQNKILEQSLDITEEAERPQAKLGVTVSVGPPRLPPVIQRACNFADL